jgi:hypothetical protein
VVSYEVVVVGADPVQLPPAPEEYGDAYAWIQPVGASLKWRADPEADGVTGAVDGGFDLPADLLQEFTLEDNASVWLVSTSGADVPLIVSYVVDR